MKVNLNTVDTQEYREWLALLEQIGKIQDTLKNNPNEKGLKMARSHAFNLISGIQSLLESVAGKEEQQAG